MAMKDEVRRMLSRMKDGETRPYKSASGVALGSVASLVALNMGLEIEVWRHKPNDWRLKRVGPYRGIGSEHARQAAELLA